MIHHNSNRRWSVIVAIAMVFVGRLAVAGTIRHDVSDYQYLNLAAQPQYDAVGRATWTEPNGSYLASGTYIGDGWVLTAAHVAGGTDYMGGGVSNFTFSFDGTKYNVADVYVHPNWAATQGSLTAGWDIALVKLTSDVVGVDPAPLFDFTNEKDYVGTIVGYGATGTGLTGYLPYSAGTKRAGQNAIDAFGGDRGARYFSNNIMLADFDNPLYPGDSTLGSSQPLPLEYMTAPGDSGGGLFVNVDGVDYLAGVTSFGRAVNDPYINSDYGDQGGFTRVSSFVDWIKSVSGISAGVLPTQLPGDANGDGVVDGEDYLVWANTFGTNPATEAVNGDFNGDGRINSADYFVWLSAFNQSAGNSTVLAVSVPQPSTLSLFVFGAVLSTLGYRRRRR